MSEMETRSCTRCEGKKTLTSGGFTGVDGTVYPETTRECYSCKGAGSFTAPNMAEIIQSITTGRGAKDGKRRLRAAWPGREHYRNRDVARAYYVWRLARFHGGKDMTMPCTADMVIGGDPFKPELNQLADEVAKVVFGSDLAAAHRWAKAFGV